MVPQNALKITPTQKARKMPVNPFKTSNLIATLVRDALCRQVIAGKSQKRCIGGGQQNSTCRSYHFGNRSHS